MRFGSVDGEVEQIMSNSEEQKQMEAAVKIQAVHRGRTGRKTMLEDTDFEGVQLTTQWGLAQRRTKVSHSVESDRVLFSLAWFKPPHGFRTNEFIQGHMSNRPCAIVD